MDINNNKEVYDIIYIGTSLLNILHYLEYNTDKNCLFIDKQTKIGGSWFIENYDNLKLESGCHVLQPINNDKINEYFQYFKQKYNLTLKKIDYVQYTKIFDKNTQSITTLDGFGIFADHIFKIFYSYNKCIELNTTVINLYINENINEIYCDNSKIYKSKKVIIPEHVKFENFFILNNRIVQNHELNISKHILFDISINYKYEFKEYSHFWFDNGILDRLNIQKIIDNRVILLCRVSREYRSLTELNIQIIIEELFAKKIFNKNTSIIYYNIIEYENQLLRSKDKIKYYDEIEKYSSSKIELLETTFLSIFIEKYLLPRLN